MTRRIAGHEFKAGFCDCGRYWIDIMNCNETHIGFPGYAHAGNLNTNEVNQIKAERERMIEVTRDLVQILSGVAIPKKIAPPPEPGYDYCC